MPTVYLIPSLLHDEGLDAIPAYITEAVLNCRVFFVENERTARRYLKQLKKDIVIDNFEWFTISDSAGISESLKNFKQKLKEGKNIGIISEAGCPGIADPGQNLVAIAQELNADIKPLVGPSAILLALMASGMNGQQFRFLGYLPIDVTKRSLAIRDLESESKKRNCTQVFIETPYRNLQLLDALLSNLNDHTRICIAVDITGRQEWIKTKTAAQWKKNKPAIHKHPAMFLVYAGPDL